VLNCSKISFCLLLAVGSLANSLSAQQNIATDESATLVMAARTRSAVFISVDSEIDSSYGPSADPTIWTDSKAKLVDVGKTGACAIDGWVGNARALLSVAASLRDWATSHPTEGPFEAINELLTVAANTWDRGGFMPGQALPKGRHPGDDITTLTCGDVVDGEPVVVKGQTIVDFDNSAGYKILNLDPRAVLYVDGVIQTWELPMLFSGDPSTVPRKIQSVNLQALIHMNEDLQSNVSAINAFRVSQAMKDLGVESPLSQSIWTETTVRAIFEPIFATVERNMSSQVGPPNNVRIITPCGRFTTTVEVDPWPTCPAKNVNAATPQKKNK